MRPDFGALTQSCKTILWVKRMKQQQNEMTQQQLRQVCVLTTVAAVLLAIWRTALTSTAFDEPLPYGIALGVTGVLLVVLLILCALKSTNPITVGGPMARVSAAGAAVAGTTMLLASLIIAHQWFVLGIMPYPSRTVVGGIDGLFVCLLIIAGLLGGVFFLSLTVNWWCRGVCKRHFMPLIALAPVLWSWVRLIRYITSHVSSLGLYRNLYDLGTIVFEMLFFIALARYVSGVGEKPSRFFFGLSLCTGLLCTISVMTQVALFFEQDRVAFETCALVMAPDFGVALLSFVIAFSQGYGTPCEEEGFEQPKEPLEDDGDDAGAEYLISDQWFTVYDPEEKQQDD